MHDGLTGLPNQRFFMARLTQVLAGWTPAPPAGADITAPSVVFLDLDGFKQVNDTHGHPTGDALLQAMATRLSATVRTGDVVARMGGDEFACLLEGPLPGPQLKRLAQKLFVKMAAPVTLPLPRGGRVTLQVAPSIGLARCPQDGTTPETLLAAADAAMYSAKRAHSQVAFASAPCA
jgi:diguanylate cyclase (GGDEF)-like protein